MAEIEGTPEEDGKFRRIAMTSRFDAAEEQWNRLMAGDQPSQVMNGPASRQGQTPHEVKADERTRLVRETTDAATKQRHANVARLKQARLSKEAEDKAQQPDGVNEDTPWQARRLIDAVE